jgi:hypothetical protein
MVAAAYRPDYFRLFSLEAEIVIILGLLLAALLSVSTIALQHTRLRHDGEQGTSAPDGAALTGANAPRSRI